MAKTKGLPSPGGCELEQSRVKASGRPHFHNKPIKGYSKNQAFPTIGKIEIRDSRGKLTTLNPKHGKQAQG